MWLGSGTFTVLHRKKTVVGRFGTLLEANTPFALQHANAENYPEESLMTQALWGTEFPNEAFIAKNQFERITRPDEALSLVGSFDILG